MDVVVWALWIWIALSAVALVVYVFRRVRYNRRQRAAVLENKPLPANPEAAKPKAKSAEPLISRTPGTSIESAGAEPTGPPVIFNNSTAAAPSSAASSASKPAPKLNFAKSNGIAKNDGIANNDGVAEAASPPENAEASESKAGSFSMGSLLAPRPDAPKTDAPKTDAPSSEATDTESAADITLPAGDKHDLDLATPNNSPEPAKTLADVLAGVRLPYDLLPVDEPNPQIADVAVTLVTMTTPAGDVGMALADELERLGYEIFSLSDSEAVAKRGTDSTGNPEDILSMMIRTDVGPEGQPMDATDGDQALPSAVAVDIWVGGGDSPLQTSRRTSLEI